MDQRLFFPATERNRGPIGDLLKQLLPTSGTVLELASGSGEHAVCFQQISDGAAVAFGGREEKPLVHCQLGQGVALWLQWRRSSASQASRAARASGCRR